MVGDWTKTRKKPNAIFTGLSSGRATRSRRRGAGEQREEGLDENEDEVVAGGGGGGGGGGRNASGVYRVAAAAQELP